jgi:hypothetical protein
MRRISQSAALLSFLLLNLLFACGCVTNPSAIHTNPDFSCPTSRIVEAATGYPNPIKQYPLVPNAYHKSVAELKDFCLRMKQLFAESNLTISEASQFYTLLEKTNGKELANGNHLFLGNECYGMPMCNKEPFVMKRQVMLKKITDDEYEVFFYHIGCGINYTHSKIHLKQGGITDISLVEDWSESSPC